MLLRKHSPEFFTGRMYWDELTHIRRAATWFAG